MSQGQPKVLIIGLDGGSWTLLNRLCDEGQMPNLRRLRDGGAPGILSSTIPPISPVAWTSFLTGLRPGRHRLYGFITSRNTYVEGPRGYAAGRPANASEIGAVPLWEVMNQHGVSTGLFTCSAAPGMASRSYCQNQRRSAIGLTLSFGIGSSPAAQRPHCAKKTGDHSHRLKSRPVL